MAEVRGSVNIAIGADVEVFKRALADAQAKATSFERNLAKAAAMSAASFVTLKEGVIGSVQAFAESEAASNRLRAALLNQGMMSTKLSQDYGDLADKLSELTGADDDAIKSMMASGQALLGNIKITDELVQAVADLAAGSGMDLSEAFQKVTKTIGTSTNALAKNGFQIADNMSRQERLADVIKQVESRYGGQAEASQNVGTTLSRLAVQFGNLREEMGARFAPAVSAVAKLLDQFIQALIKSPALLDFISAVAMAVTTVFGLISAFVAVKAAVLALAPVFAVLSGPVGIVVAVITAAAAAALLLWKHFDAIKIAFNAFASDVSTIGQSLGEVLTGIFTLDLGKVSAGMEGLKSAFKAGYGKMQDDLAAHEAERARIQDEATRAANEKNAADREQERALESDHVGRLKEIARNKTEALLLQRQIGTKAMVDLVNQESALLKQIDDEAASSEVEGKRQRLAALNAMLEDNLSRQEKAKIEHEQRMSEIEKAFDQAKSDIKALGYQADIDLSNEQREKLYAMALTEKEAKREVDFEMVKDRIERNNQFLRDQARYNEVYAKMNQASNSLEMKDANMVAGQLVALSQSKNNELKAIGKAAALWQIGVSTAEGAVKAYSSLVGLPLIGPALGAAAAAAVVAFGAERTSQVLAAAQGGVVTGGIPGVDSVPAMLTPGELVVPKQNFNEVVGSVQASRDGGGMGEVVAELQALRGEIGSVRPNMVTINGDVMSDDSFVDRLIQKISDRLEFGNARLVGVTS